MSPLVLGVVLCGLPAQPVSDGATAPNAPRLVAQSAGPGNWACFSPDGKLVLSGGNRNISLWDAATGLKLHEFAGPSSTVYQGVFSADGKYVLTGEEDKAARLRDALSGEERAVFKGPSRASSVALAPGGKFALTGGGDGVVRLYDISTCKEVRTFEGHAVGISSVAFAPDGKRILSGDRDGTVRVWDAETGKEVRKLAGHTRSIHSVAWSPDGRWALTGSNDGMARVWDPATGREAQVFKGDPWGNAVAFSQDGKLAMTADGVGIPPAPLVRVWDVGSGREIRQLRGHTKWFSCATFSPDGKHVLTDSGDAFLRLWDVATGAEVRRFEGRTRGVTAVAFSQDGRGLMTGNAAGGTHLWDAAAGKQTRQFIGHTDRVSSIAFSADGKWALTASYDATARLWETGTGREVRQFRRPEPGHDFLREAAFSTDGKHVLTDHKDDPRLWETGTGKLLRRFEMPSGRSGGSAAFSPDGSQVLGTYERYLPDKDQHVSGVLLFDVAMGKRLREIDGFGRMTFTRDGKAVLSTYFKGTPTEANGYLWDLTSGKTLQVFKGHTSMISEAVQSPDGKWVLTGSLDTTARLWDARTGREVRVFRGHSDWVEAVTFSPDGGRVVTGGADGTTRVWDPATGRELCRLLSFADGTWAVIDPDGRYDASDGGDVVGLHWVVETEPIALKQLKNRYYDPGLLAKYLGFNKQPFRPVATFTGVKLHPEVSVELPAVGTTAKITLTNRGGGIGKIQVLVNGKELLADARGPKPDADAKATTLIVHLDGAANLVPGRPNEIEVIAYNAEGYLASRGLRKVFSPGGAAEEYKPELYAIVCGVSHYADPKLNLKYAAKDAQDFATALELAGNRFFGADKVHITLLTTSDTPGADRPTKENITKAFEAARKARPDDVLVIYFAGHGTTLGRGSDVYLFPTPDARTLDPAAFADPAVLANTAVTSDELTAWLKADVMRVQRQVMVLDTCAAGAAAAKLTEQRDVSGDQVRALDRFKDRTGFHVLMGCAADAVSYETTQYAQGLLTYTLLEGMRGASLREGEFVDVAKLFGYATDRVPALAGDVGGVQRPLVAAPRGSSFDVGRLTAEDKPKVPLALKRPLVLQSNFQDEDRLDDVLGLKKLVDQRLRDTAAVGRGAKVVFVDAGEFPGAYRLAGRYATSGDKVSVRVKVFRGEVEVAAFTVEGDKGKSNDIAAKIVTETEKRLPQPGN